MYVVKLNPIGEVQWSATEGGPMADYCRAVTTDARGDYVLAGYSYSFATGGSDLYIVTLVGDQSTAVNEIDTGVLPDAFTLSQNYPNPFNASTHIRYTLPERTRITMTIYNLLGQVVKAWTDLPQSAGTYELEWDGLADDGSMLASGVYFYRLETPAGADNRKMVLLK
jgi:hypothetical protein